MRRAAAGSSAGQPRPRELLHLLWETKLWVGLLVLLIYAFGFAVLMPILPTLLTNFFASRFAGHPIDCEGYTPGQEPTACRNAHSDVVTWTSWTSLVSNSFLLFFFAPLVGDLSDRLGRKPFIIAGLSLSLLSTSVVWAYLAGHISLLWYYPANCISGVISAIVVFLSYAADLLPKHHRTAGFGLIIASFSLGFMVGPLLGARLTPVQAVLTNASTSIAAVLLAVVALPESLPAAPVPEGGHKRTRPLDACLSLARSWKLITSRALFMKLALCMAIVGVVSEGIQDMLVQYLQLTVGFTTADQGLLFMILGACNLVVQGFALTWLVPRLGEQRLLLLGLVLSCLEQALLALVHSKGAAFAAISIGSMAGVAWPAISAIKSNNTPPEQQGLVQGALAGIRALATGMGPLVFAQLFRLSTHTESPFGYHPGVVFWVSCALTAVAASIAATVDPAAGNSRPHTTASGEHGSEADKSGGRRGLGLRKHEPGGSSDSLGSGVTSDVEAGDQDAAGASVDLDEDEEGRRPLLDPVRIAGHVAA